ncbi:uncharacterized protein LOC113279861 [Papaver somniferum]|uniref:uncharacterized protein LOC113279861 n=1 Tax=Papaver somniferum TaxID=3469 RepID=UPI000E6F9143|nr:uncharacterized protein LOC113279861 [Papaver somniferum]
MKEGNDVLDRDVLKLLREILNKHNNLVHVFHQGSERENLLDCQLIIKEQPKGQLQYTLPSASQVAAIVPIGDKNYQHTEREIIVQTTSANLFQVFETGGNYDLMQYPLLLPYGSYEWDINSKDKYGRKMPCRGYYSYIVQRYQDAMALVQKYGKPDIFLTMICNPLCPEIVAKLRPGQSASDRPDLTTRVFRAKFEKLKEDIYNKNVLGRVVAHVHVIEFQKRGLSHVHMLIILEKEDKLQGPDDYDSIVRAEIPDKKKEPELYKCVKKRMIHGLCGRKCMMEGKYKRGFPKQFCKCTVQGKDAYPVYQRRDYGNTIQMTKTFIADNRFVVPYNPWLLQKYDFHMNVEVCSTVQSVKYLYKYIYKGPDCISFRVQLVHPESENNEVTRYINARWVCAQQEIWRIYRFAMNKMCPSVQRLHLHLPKQNSVMLYENQTIDEVLENENNSKKMLTEYFVTNACDPMARRWLYREFPEYYKWDKAIMKWQRRRTNHVVIGRGATSYEDLLTLDGRRCHTSKSAAEARGFLENDNSLRACSDLIEEEVSIPVSDEDMMNVDKLNEDQSRDYDAIMGAVRRKESRVFFVDGPGGTRKTFLYRVILSTVRRNCGISIATATSGVATIMLPGGRTAHSRFKIPFTPTTTSTCDIAKNDKLADLLR